MNILYVHGLNGKENSNNSQIIKRIFPESKCIAPYFDFNNKSPKKILSEINNIIFVNDIDLIIGTSLGAFFVLKADSDCYKIVINPCMIPSIELPKLDNTIDISDYKQLESKKFNIEYPEFVYGIFGTNDELFSYVNKFSKEIGFNILTTNDKHRITETSLITNIKKIWDIFSKHKIPLNETIKNFWATTKVGKESMNKYVDEVWDLLEKSYSKIGGIYGCPDKETLLKKSGLWKLQTYNGKIICCIIYSIKNDTRKMIYCCSDGSNKAKGYLYAFISEDLKFIDRKVWLEVSGVMEHICQKLKAIPIPFSIVKKLLPNKELKQKDDGYHYMRKIGDVWIKKIMYGNFSDNQELNNI